MDETAENEKIEIQLLLQAAYLKYGYDFRRYAGALVRRRLLRRLSLSGLKSISEMQNRLLHDRSFFEALLSDLSINVTEMFRDPSFYRALRDKVIPALKGHPFIKIWHAGCSTGEEVYSMAILLKEEGMLEKTQIYGTDFSHQVIQKAKEGIYPIDRMKEYGSNYRESGGSGSLSDYYTARYDYAVMDRSLKTNVILADHNLVTDGVFGEINLILCRNVLIYFNRDLQDRVFGLFRDSLCAGGFLCLGPKESVRFSKCADDFEDWGKTERIYRRR